MGWQKWDDQSLAGNWILCYLQEQMARCLLIHSSHQLHEPSLPAIIRSNWIPCEFAVTAMEESKGWKQEKGVHVFRGCQESIFQAERMARVRTLQWKCASRVGGVVWWLVWLGRIETQDSGRRWRWEGSRGHTTEVFGAMTRTLTAFWTTWDSIGEFWQRKDMIWIHVFLFVFCVFFYCTGSLLQHSGISCCVARV